MGAGVSNWRLARAVSWLGQLGVVAGTALDEILSRRLQDGDAEGHVRRALEQFPFPRIARKILESLGGTLTLEHTGDQGTTFLMCLPKAAESGMPDAASSRSG